MAYSEYLAERVEEALRAQGAVPIAQRLFGGLGYMVAGKLRMGVVGEEILVRLDPALGDTPLERPGCRVMDLTGRRMRGWFLLEGGEAEDDQTLAYWVGECLRYNPQAPKRRP